MRPPEDGHRWFCIEDRESEVTWLFDLTFLASGYRCVYGAGCRSIVPDEADASPDLGCCVHGAHFVDEEDLESVRGFVDQLGPEEWQFHDKANSKGGPFKRTRSGDWVTRKHKGACILLNRNGFAGGEGCALHAAALRRGERPMDWKPDVCWQVPIRLDIHENEYGYETIMVRSWQRRDWGPGGDDFHWWCIEDHQPYRGEQPVYVTSRDELVEMVGEDIYSRLAAELERTKNETPVTLV